MVKRIKTWLYQVLGRKQYLHLVSGLFFLAYRTGLLRRDPDYSCHYYVRRLVEPGDYIIDIGANLGYYSVLFAEWTGPEGAVFSVEPVPLYRSILHRNTDTLPQVTVIPYALGSESATVTMGIPGSDPHRHGLTQILSSEEQEDVQKTFEAEVRPPTVLFDDLSRLDYVKCDVEGFEGEVLPAMKELLREHRPIVQVEVSAENRQAIYDLMDRLGYRAYFVQENELVSIEAPTDRTRGDWIFKPLPS